MNLNRIEMPLVTGTSTPTHSLTALNPTPAFVLPIKIEPGVHHLASFWYIPLPTASRSPFTPFQPPPRVEYVRTQTVMHEVIY